jgi:two-component system chemotaxis response regulator CheB
MKKIGVLIIEDSDVVRQLLQYLIARDPRLEVAGAARSAEDGLRLLDRISPDVISLDIRLPGMNGFEATRRIMAEKPTPIVVVSASVESEDLKITMNALQAGALAVVEKPAGVSHADYEFLSERLCTQLAIMSQVHVVRQRGNGRADHRKVRENPGTGTPPQSGRMLGIACSTGGPGALTQLLGGLPADFPLPIVVVQHITHRFMEGFASWLSTVCPFRVTMVSDRERMMAGRIYLAAGDRHLCVAEDSVKAVDGDPVSMQRPSGTVLFQSMASRLGGEAIGVILTGMGEDGAEGLLELRRAGGYTIAEDESTAVVYGMPGAAVRIGAVCESLPLQHIAPRIQTLALRTEALSYA